MRPLIIVLATLAAAKDLQKLIKQMTLDEKLGLLHGSAVELHRRHHSNRAPRRPAAAPERRAPGLPHA